MVDDGGRMEAAGLKQNLGKERNGEMIMSALMAPEGKQFQASRRPSQDNHALNLVTPHCTSISDSDDTLTPH